LCLDVIDRHLTDQEWAVLRLGDADHVRAFEEHLVASSHRLEVESRCASTTDEASWACSLGQGRDETSPA
jgi:hypothetical protein